MSLICLHLFCQALYMSVNPVSCALEWSRIYLNQPICNLKLHWNLPEDGGCQVAFESLPQASGRLRRSPQALSLCSFKEVFIGHLNWCFWTVVLEKTVESPLDSKEIKPVSLKGNQPWIFIRRTDTEAEAPIFWPSDVKSQLIGKDPDARKD